MEGRPCKNKAGAGIERATDGPCYQHRELIQDLGDMNIRERKFIEFYLGEHWFNGRRSAIAAGYSEGGADWAAHNLLNNPRIKKKITERLNAASASAEEVLFRMTSRARGSILPFTVIENGRRFIDLAQPGIEQYMHLIRKIKQKTLEVEYDDEDGVHRTKLLTEIELYDAQQADRDLAKAHALFSDGIEVNVDVRLRQMSDRELLDRIEERRRRLRFLLEQDDAPVNRIAAKASTN